MKDFTIRGKRKILSQIFIFLFWIIIWQIVYGILQRDIYLPSPFNVFMRLKELVFLKTFWQAIASSIGRVAMGVFFSIVVGTILGIISSMNDFIYNLINPLIVAIKSTPVLSFIMIALMWFSSSNVPTFICFLMCFPVIWTNIVGGLANIDRKLLQMAKIYRLKKWVVIKKIYLPSILPYFSAACITSLGLGWKVSVAAEVLSHPRNAIGSHLYSAKIYLDSSDLFAWTLVVIFFSLLFEKVFAYCLEKITIKKSSKVSKGCVKVGAKN
ncbi:ABC-type nitrate/sulfonate/bicarbonate transport system, permease component [Clostridium aceticum]|uniref:ABC-type nitrate/sulfonate/bicarbonate transport system, permease component n=1 Tax=Clostridium aceticum TaxID=84022 RepID=A0A0D8I7P5_9CLOT|nr:ABC transporter permease subunit [Clostridium aceticum]AKL97245.1 ABC-type nitrate/sulfonate/bicarbonate transport system, permease component [Clostridium aceticum]KJF26273.1 ABC transporter permease [Clostridium aceticum]